jgi:16S rRNA (adenine1518-N6/adenine1519-N6)-dimethyltransferase
MTTPKILLNSRSLRPRKRLGQNFLANPAIAAAIVERSRLGPEDEVVEIGPGLGALTIPLARAARRIYAIEKDAHLIEVLRGELSANGVSNVMIRHADALEEDFAALASGAGRRLVVFGNLPYNISSQVVVKLVASRAHVSRAVLMFQRELARRLTSVPGGRDYGRITALLGYCADVRALLRVGAGNFHPAPLVDSEVLEIDFEVQRGYPPHDEGRFVQVLAAAFGQRRKNLKNALAAGLHLSPEKATQMLTQAGIDPARRAETLAPAGFVAIAIEMTRLKAEG